MQSLFAKASKSTRSRNFAWAPDSGDLVESLPSEQDNATPQLALPSAKQKPATPSFWNVQLEDNTHTESMVVNRSAEAEERKTPP